MRNIFIVIVFLVRSSYGQLPVNAAAVQNLPSAPQPQTDTNPLSPKPSATEQPSFDPQSASFGVKTPLSLKQAEVIALKNNPQISVARLAALASQQVTREVRSSLWPTATANLTAVDADPGSRITAGELNNPVIYPRAAAGVVVNQMITDFGRTTKLAASANLAAKAETQNALATKQQILLAVDQTFYSELQAHAVLAVAQQTVATRQTLSDQVGVLFKNKLKSQLDFSFANVNLAQARLLLLDAENNENAALATLSAVLGYSDFHDFQPVDDTTPITSPPGNVDDLISQAFATRPEIQALAFQYRSAQKFQAAEHDLAYPTVRAVGVVGETPVRNPILSDWYGAVGVNVGIPLFNGFLYAARSHEAHLKSEAAEDRLRDLRNRISRDVRASWLNANTAFQRVGVTQLLSDQAELAFDLAQTRYHLGLSSIVELTQAQLQLTQAQISNAQAGYDYRLSLAVLRYQTTGL